MRKTYEERVIAAAEQLYLQLGGKLDIAHRDNCCAVLAEIDDDAAKLLDKLCKEMDKR